MGKMYCPDCRREMEEDWAYCPYCGTGQEVPRRRALFPSMFSDLFRDIEEEFRRLDRLFERDFRPFEEPHFSGVDISIVMGPDQEPTMEVQTHGDMQDHEPEIRKNLNIGEKKTRPPPDYVREPVSRMKQEGNRLILEMDVPLCKDEEDCEVRKMQESVEIKAYAGDTAYFKLFRIPRGARIVSKKLQDEKLTVVLEV
jgi:HSP20 family molecular chaperone IbpA